VLPELAGFIRLDRVSDRTVQGLLLVLILFTIVNTILMSVLERMREFAVLRALGTSGLRLGLQLLCESAYLAALGCAVGLGLGGGLAWLVQVRGWDLAWLYPEGLTISGLAVSTRLHAKVRGVILLGIAGLVFVVTLLASLPPIRRAVRVPMADTLR
jgi:ABC-type lipoprotein release transport system permease subunit